LNPSKLKARRLALGISKTQLAAHVGVTATHIDLAEREELSRDVTFLLNLALSLLEGDSMANDELQAVAV
jgi:transcriptional regulator with XRE-family HTH domain